MTQDKAKKKAMKYLRSEEIISSNLSWNMEIEKAIDIALKERDKEMINWANEWFDKKRLNNDMWRMNQDELTSLFLEEFEKEWLK